MVSDIWISSDKIVLSWNDNWNGALHREQLKLDKLYLSIEIVGLDIENSRLGIYHSNPNFIL